VLGRSSAFTNISILAEELLAKQGPDEMKRQAQMPVDDDLPFAQTRVGV